MDSLPVIPTPIQARLREFVIRLLPPIVFVGVIVTCALVWRDGLHGSTVAAVGEGMRSTVACPQAGTILQVRFQPYQIVKKGDPLMVVMPTDPRRHVDLLRSEMQLAQLRLQPSLADQNAIDYERVRVDLMKMQSELAVARINLARAEYVVRRTEPLLKQQIVSEDEFDLAQKTRDTYIAEIESKSNSIVQIQAQMNRLRFLGDPNGETTNSPTTSILNRLEQTQMSLTTNWGPITLVAPITGMINVPMRQEGEYALEGEPLVVINGLWSERIVAYLRQPYPVNPEVGLEVRVMTHDSKRQMFTSQIVQVGSQTEIITNALAYVRQGALVDVGLPIVVLIPDEVKIRPGEIVDVFLQKKKNQSQSFRAAFGLGEAGQAEPEGRNL